MNQTGPSLTEAVIESWRSVFGNAAPLARASVLPFFLFLALQRIDQIVGTNEGAYRILWGVVSTVLSAVPAIILLMPWYRHLLAARIPALASRPALGWSFVMMVRWAGLDVMFFIAMAPITAVLAQSGQQGSEAASGVAGAVLFYYMALVIAAYLIYGRMGLSVPAAAAESDHRYMRSWLATRENGWRIGFAILICWLSIEFPISILRAPLAVDNPTLAMQYLDATLAAVFRVVNELLGAAVFTQFYLASLTGKSDAESV
jgi:hypothetical protein